MSFIAVDIEGNGGTPPAIVELAATRVDPTTGLGEARSWLVKPPAPIQWRAKKIHGISNESVRSCPPIREIEGEIVTFLGNEIAVAHNASVDLGIMRKELLSWRPAGFIDTLTLARKLVPGRPSYKLYDLVNFYSLTDPAEKQEIHRAQGDAIACAKLFLKLVELARDRSLQPSALVTRLTYVE